MVSSDTTPSKIHQNLKCEWDYGWDLVCYMNYVLCGSDNLKMKCSSFFTDENKAQAVCERWKKESLGGRAEGIHSQNTQLQFL